jgi:alpha-tubulin suppressor-like RCC1 family protein
MPLNEGQTVQYTVTTTNTADGTVLYWKTTGNTTNSDIVGGNTGSITITNNQAVFNVTTSADVNTDGTKTLGIALSTGSQSGPTVVSTANPITVADTSLSPEFKLFSFGSNEYGQLGLNDQNNRSSPVQVGTAINWSKISAGFHSTAIKTDGTLWSWGLNSVGRLGHNDIIDRSSPTQVGSLTNWSAISGSMAIKNDGTLWLWGSNSYGQLGQNDRVYRSSPTQVGTNTNWSKISASNQVRLAIKTDGTLWSWGYNFYGQLGLPGQGTLSPFSQGVSRSSPTQVGGGTNWSQVSAGNDAGAGVKTDGTLWAWGAGDYGQLGTNSTQAWPNNITTPNQVGNLTNWAMVSVGTYAMIAVKNDGTLWAWGSNLQGQLGMSGGSKSSPTQIGSSTNWAQAKITSQHAVAIKTDGTLWTWGNTSDGRTGHGVGQPPTQVGTSTNWYEISAGAAQTAAIGS